MALTVVPIKKPATIAGESGVYDITFDSSYPTGGMAVTNLTFGFKGNVVSLFPTGKGAGNRICEYDAANGKLKLFSALGTEVANASDQSAVTVRVLAIGDRDL